MQLKRILCLLMVAILGLVTMSGCVPDLGDFQDEDEYRDFFGDFKLYNKSLSKSTYSVGDFYYEGIDEEFTASMDSSEYSYLIIEITTKKIIQEVYLFISSTEPSVLIVDLTITNLIPSNFRSYDYVPPEPSEEEDDEEEDAAEEPDDEFPYLGTSSLSVSQAWNSVGFTFGSGAQVDDGYYLIFRFKNNTAFGKKEGLPLVSFKTTGLFVRAVDPE